MGGWVGGRTGCLGRRKGKCGSTQSKPDHMFQSAGISPLALTGELCKRLLICESRVEKLGVGGGWLGGLRPLTGPSVDFFFFFLSGVSLEAAGTVLFLEVLTATNLIRERYQRFHIVQIFRYSFLILRSSGTASLE